MKKKTKKILLISMTLVLVVVAGVVYNYYGVVKDFVDIAKEDPLDDDSLANEEVLANPFDGLLGEDGAIDGQGLAQGQDGAGLEGQVEEQEKTEAEIQQQIKADKQELEDTKEPSYEMIVKTYRSSFNSLQSNQEAEMYGLIASAKADYEKAKQNGKSVTKLGFTYLNKAKGLESKANKEFKSLKSELEGVLKKNSYSRDIVEEIEGYYNQRKKIMKSELMSKVNNL